MLRAIAATAAKRMTPDTHLPAPLQDAPKGQAPDRNLNSRLMSAPGSHRTDMPAASAADHEM